MKNHLTSNDPRGWYECRFLRNPPHNRVCRWWAGTFLADGPGTPVEGGVCNLSIDQREYTEFVRLRPVIEKDATCPTCGGDGELSECCKARITSDYIGDPDAHMVQYFAICSKCGNGINTGS